MSASLALDPPLGGIAPLPLIAFVVRASIPCAIRAAHPAMSPTFGAPAMPGVWQVLQTCATCHALGIAGAPKVGDKAGWAPRIAQGIDALTASAIKGKGAMPPKGGSSASDDDIKAVVTYMVNASK